MVDQEVGPSRTNTRIFVINGHFNFTPKYNVLIIKFDSHGALINNLLKSVAKNFVHFHSAAYDCVSQFFVFFILIQIDRLKVN